MGRMVFVFKSILCFVKSEKALTLFILLGMVVCDTIFLVFGNVFWSDARSNAYEIYKNNVVTFQFDALDIDRFLEATEGRDYITSTFFSCTELDDENKPIVISAYSPAFDEAGQRIRIGHGLTGAHGECVMSDWYFQWDDSVLPGSIIGRELHFLGADWTCAGLTSPSSADAFDILIDMADFKACVGNRIRNGSRDQTMDGTGDQTIAGTVDQTMNGTGDQIMDGSGDYITAAFRYERGTSLIEVRQFADQLKEEFRADFATVPSRTAGTGFGEFLRDMSEMLILLMIAIINCMFLYRFLLAKRMYVYGIFKLQGMDNGLTLAGLCVEMLIFLAVAFSFSLLLYVGGTALFGQMSTVAQHVPEIYFSFLIIGAMNLAFFGLAAARLVRSSPVELIRESVVG